MNRPDAVPSRVKTAALSAYSLTFTGLFLIMVSVLGSETWHWPVWVSTFVRDLGLLLSAVMAGSILHEKLIRDDMLKTFVSELETKLKANIPLVPDIANQTAEAVHFQLSQHPPQKIPVVGEIAHQTAEAVHMLFSQHPPRMTGIRVLHDVRRNFSGYYTWVNEHKPQELFFAGRSVLHRVDADIRANTGGSAEDVLFRRLKENSKIKILFLDPRTDILERLAKEEGQTLQAMLGDIATSIGICHRLFRLLQENYHTLQPTAELLIRVYDRVPYFAYHKQDSDVIVGFYFLSTKGSSSAAYEVIDDVTKQVFGDHFIGIMSEAASNTLVEFDGARGRPTVNDALFEQLEQCLATHLGEEKVQELLNPKRDR